MTRALPALLIVVVAATASAQGYPGGGGMGGGGRGMGGGGRGGGMGGGRSSSYSPPNPSADDVEKQDPVKLLLDKHKKLKLDNTQSEELKALDVSLKYKNAAYYGRIDSLHKSFKVPSSGYQRSTGSDDGARASLMENRQMFRDALMQIRDNNKVARDSAIVLLKDPQKKKAYDMLEKQQEESDKMLRGPGGEEGGGTGGGRRRPPPA